MGPDVGADSVLESLTNNASHRDWPIIGCNRYVTFFQEWTDICNALVLRYGSTVEGLLENKRRGWCDDW